MSHLNITVIGGGSLGTSLAFLLSGLTGESVTVIEMEDEVGRNYSGRNEGIVHRPFFLPPGAADLTAATWINSYEAWREASMYFSGSWVVRGMLYIAQNEEQAKSLDVYRRWGVSHGMSEDELLVLEGDEISRIEDGVTGDAALFSRSEGSVSYARLLKGLAGLAEEQGCRFVYGCRAKVTKRARRTLVTCGEHELETDLLINSAGGSSLDILKQTGKGEDLTELYAGGVYYRLSTRPVKERLWEKALVGQVVQYYRPDRWYPL
ncbi:MAG: NAD(P)/FAD-dependent oxidoreductase, partial [Nitrososphaeria archaeon]